MVPIKGMHCASCAKTIEKAISKVPGVAEISVNFGTEKAAIEYDSSEANLDQMNEKIKPFGYELNLEDHSVHLGIDQPKQEKLDELNKQKRKVQFVMPIALFVFVIMMWEIASKAFESRLPEFFVPMELYSKILLILSSIVLFWIGQPFLKGIQNFIKYKVANMDTLIGIGTLTAYLYSAFIVLFPEVRDSAGLPETNYFDVAIVVIGFIILGKYLEARSKLKTGEAIEKLMNLQAKTALVERDGKEVEISIDQVILNDIVIVKPGGKIPVDGDIVEGKSSIDESMVTGESIPIDKERGDSVIGGTINKYGAFKFKAKKIGADTLLSNIIEMVEEAQGSRAPIQRMADQISGVFVPVVLVIAILTLLTWLILGSQFIPFSEALTFGLLSFVGILVIACPCALGLATPTAIIVGVGKGAQNGILIKNAESLEKLHKINTIVVDKTGTITKGKPEVTDIVVVNSEGAADKLEVLRLLASLEKNSEHPLAVAIQERANELDVKLAKADDFEIIEGKGLKGIVEGKLYHAGNLKLMDDLKIDYDGKLIASLAKQGKTPVVFANDKKVLATIAIADTIKEKSAEAVEKLHKLGVQVVMLTGDNKNTAEYIAKKVGIDKVFAEVLPQEKAEKVKELQNEGLVVAMAGDGVNDAPALAQSDVGIAMGTGTDVAIESADITLLAGDITKIPRAVKLSKKTMRTIKENLFWAFIYNLIGIPVAAGLLYPFFGILLNPVFAGLAMAFSSVSVVTNSLRLKFVKI
ncbi:MAG: Heavy metal translocating P-type ATPase [candidate division WS6 bacterium GW2011_GWA2_37_6]|uniref:Heavy metal translocating P-type ATPase n=1 Tax=candidate division WS6 bacterium GW2011_GWA2_37_6 TaxID=1619087 RepID=A0A0G0GYU8_9BACT|nr:MAG: Heavy metal translocating P-type ATPase [candidate division WS6 bacterium GW2011_GWA2_37_6]